MTKRRKWKRILRGSVRCILAVIVGVFVYVAGFSAVAKMKDPNAISMPFGFGVSRVLSGSMEPIISTDDLVFIKKADGLSVGDIVLYNTGKSNVLHRIKRIEGDTLYTQGDANNAMDPPFSKDAVLGVYTGKIAGGGKVLSFVTKPPFIMGVVFLLMAIAVTWMFLDEYRENKRLDNIRKEIERMRAENESLRRNL